LDFFLGELEVPFYRFSYVRSRMKNLEVVRRRYLNAGMLILRSAWKYATWLDCDSTAYIDRI
jgi:hypothetical protein